MLNFGISAIATFQNTLQIQVLEYIVGGRIGKKALFKVFK